MASSKLPEADFKLFTALNKHQVRYMVFGFTAAVLQGAHVVTQDIDLWVKDLGSSSFKLALQEVGAFYIPPSLHAQTPPMLGPKRFSLIDHVKKHHL